MYVYIHPFISYLRIYPPIYPFICIVSTFQFSASIHYHHWLFLNWCAPSIFGAHPFWQLSIRSSSPLSPSREGEIPEWFSCSLYVHTLLNRMPWNHFIASPTYLPTNRFTYYSLPLSSVFRCSLFVRDAPSRKSFSRGRLQSDSKGLLLLSRPCSVVYFTTTIAITDYVPTELNFAAR